MDILNKLQIAELAAGTIEDIRGRGAAKSRSIKPGKYGISLAVDDLYLQDEPIVITARVTSDRANFKTLKAEINSVSRENSSVNLDFVPQNNEWVIKSENLALNPGLYRIKVQTDNTSEDAPNAVHNLFEVADIDG